jgi:hypothetical protein
MGPIKSFALCFSLLLLPVAAYSQESDAAGTAANQAQQQALKLVDQLQKDSQDAQRLDRMQFEADFADMIPPERRLRVDVASGLESSGIRLIVDVGITRDPQPLPAGPRDGSEYPMDVQVQSPGGGYFAVRCNTSGCVFSPSAQEGTVIRGKLFAIPGDGCIYSTTELGAASAASVRTAHCLKNGKLESVTQPIEGSDL